MVALSLVIAVIATPAGVGRSVTPPPPTTVTSTVPVAPAPLVVADAAAMRTLPRAALVPPAFSLPERYSLPAARRTTLIETRNAADDWATLRVTDAVAEPEDRPCLRALKLDPPRRGGGGGPLATRLQLTLTGDSRTLDADFNVKGTAAGVLRRALGE